MSHIKISKTEWEVMRILWTQGECYSNDVTTLLSEKFEWKSSTIKTLIARLVKKGYVGTHKEGNRYRYFPTISETESLQQTRTELAHHICSTKMGKYIAALIEENPLSHADIALLAEKLNKKSGVALEKVPCNCIKGQCTCIDDCCSQSIKRRNSMKQVTFSVPEISCGHCTSSIEKGLTALAGVHSVSSDIAAKTTTVEFDDSIDVATLIEEFDNIGFDATEA